MESKCVLSAKLARGLKRKPSQLKAMKLVDGTANTCAAVSGQDAPALKRHKREKKITFDDFELLRKLGEGGYGKVILARDRCSEQLCAMKIVDKTTVSTETRAAWIMCENRVFRNTDHPFLVALKFSFQTTDRLCFAMEFANGGDLSFHLLNDGVFGEEKIRFYGAEVLLALEYLHGRGIIHRDLKPDNLLLDGVGHIKVTDFGLCKEGIFYGKTTDTICGTPEYLAPEILEGGGYGRAIDWWSFGAVLYELIFGEEPFYSANQDLMFENIVKDEVRFPRSLSRAAKSLLMGLLTKDPKLRLGGGRRGADDIKEHEFFRSVPWEGLLAKEIEPPFKPQVASDTDVRYFDREFTEEDVSLTPLPDSRSNRTRMFRNFSYVKNDSRQRG